VGPAPFIMILIGCADGAECAPVMTLPVAFQSEASCLDARSEMVAAGEGLGYDRLFAECRAQSRPARNQAGAGKTPLA